VARELARYKLDLLGVQKVRGMKGPLKQQRIILLSRKKDMNIIN